MKHDDAIAAALANRSFVYTYLWRAFAAEPDEAFLSAVADDATLEECKLLAGEDSRAVQVQEALAAFVSNVPDAPDALKGEYTKLFEGPGKLPAPPWESVYVCGEDLLFQPSTLEVREAYRSAGYQATGYPHEADDHLATELDFMGALSKRTQAAYEEGGQGCVPPADFQAGVFLGHTPEQLASPVYGKAPWRREAQGLRFLSAFLRTCSGAVRGRLGGA